MKKLLSAFVLLCVGLFFVATYVKHNTFKNDYVAYEELESQITKKYLEKGQEIQQRMAALQKEQEVQLHKTLTLESSKLMDDLSLELSEIKPQTEPVKKFNEFYIESTNSNKAAVANLLNGMLKQDASVMMEATQALQNTQIELQKKKDSLQQSANTYHPFSF